jgi:hypothetical protein
MKKKILKFLVLTVLLIQASCVQDQIMDSTRKDKSLENKAMGYNNFIGKEVYTFLLSDSIRHYSRYALFDQRPGSLSGLSLGYDTNTTIEVYVSKFVYMEKFSMDRDWYINQFYREKISRIKVIENDVIIFDSKTEGRE